MVSSAAGTNAVLYGIRIEDTYLNTITIGAWPLTAVPLLHAGRPFDPGERRHRHRNRKKP
ncbi:MAG: hypothetical protein ACLT8E_02100 [Akkermansia sp.]